MLPRPRACALLALLAAPAIVPIAGCAPIRDARTAHTAQTNLLGLSELDLETCLGVPVRRTTLGQSTLLTYEQVSSGPGGVNLTLPVLGGISFTNAGNCRANIRLDQGRVVSVRYTGETDSDFAQDSYCAPVVRTCVRNPLQYAPATPGGQPVPAMRQVYSPAGSAEQTPSAAPAEPSSPGPATP